MAARTRVGLDVGTSKVVTAHGDSSQSAATQLNAFFAVPFTARRSRRCSRTACRFYRDGDELIVYGTAAEKFAHMFNAECRRPMAKGILNPRERSATCVLETILALAAACRILQQAKSWRSRYRPPPARVGRS